MNECTVAFINLPNFVFILNNDCYIISRAMFEVIETLKKQADVTYLHGSVYAVKCIYTNSDLSFFFNR